MDQRQITVIVIIVLVVYANAVLTYSMLGKLLKRVKRLEKLNISDNQDV